MSETNPLLGWAEHYVRRGWKIIPIHVIINGECTCRRGSEVCALGKDAGKHPVIGRWTDPSQMVSTQADAFRWWGRADAIPYSMGLVCGEISGVWILDMDPRNGGDVSLEELEAEIGVLPRTLVAETGGGGRHFYFKVPAGFKIKKGPLHKDLPGLDVQGEGAQSLLPPSTHWAGKRYQWLTPLDTEIAEAPEALLTLIRGDRGSGGGAGGSFNLDAAIATRITEGGRNNALMKFATSMSRRTGVDTDEKAAFILAAVRTYNAENLVPPLDEDEVRKTVVSALTFVRDTPNGFDDLDPGQRAWVEDRLRARQVSEQQAPEPAQTSETDGQAETGGPAGEEPGGGQDGPSDPGPGEGGDGRGDDGPPDGLPPDADSLAEDGQPGQRSLTENGNARRIVDYFGEDLRYTPGLGWHYWAASHWAPDTESLHLMELVRNLPVRIVSEVPNWPAGAAGDVIGWANQSKGVGNMKKTSGIANTDPRVFVGQRTWDADPFLLGVRNGVIDLRTGALLPPSKDQYITKRSDLDFDPRAPRTRWEIFLDQVTEGDKDFQAWLQRAVGYSLTGDTREEKFFMIYGPPGSGKSTIIEVIKELLGDYALTFTADNIMQQKGGAGGGGADFYFNAQILGKRLITVSELPDAQNMKEDMIKRLTGQDTLVGRHPGERPFQFESMAKLWMATNHRPRIDDPGIWRRMLAVPFMYKPQIVDKTLKPYLRDPAGGLPGILSWGVEGAVRWAASRDGIGSCSVVSEATEEYRKSEDRLGIFLSEETREGEGSSVSLGDLHAVYDMWSRDRMEKAAGKTYFRKKLIERGFDIVKDGRVELVEGVSLLPRAVETQGHGMAALYNAARI